MPFFRKLSAGFRDLLHKERVESELDEELREFVDASAAEKMRCGINRAQAYREARMEMGGAESVKEKVRAATWESWIETLWNDVRFGFRLLRFNPIFATTAILSLALGIGANTAIFQLIDAVRLRTLLVHNPQEIARVAIDGPRASGSFNSRYPDLTYALWEQIRSQQEGFSSMFAWAPTQFNIAPGGEVHNVQGLWVSGEFFSTLGVAPALGRLLTPEDDRPGCGSAGAAISNSFWQREYGGERSAIGQHLIINRHPVAIIGVTSADFYGVEMGRYFDIAVPVCAEPAINGENSPLQNRSGWWLSVMGRLKPGWNVERAGAQLRAISAGIFEVTAPAEFNPEQAKHFVNYRLRAFPADSGISDLRGSYEKPLWLLLGLAGLVLLIAAANLGNLMLARASTREKEMAMRMAVGAGRGRLIRQLLAESLLLAAIGAVVGAVLARSLSQVLVASMSTKDDPLFMNLGTDWRVLGFTAALAVLACVLFGLAPALRATNVAPGLALKESAGALLRKSRSRFGLRRVLVVSQIALSLTLLVGALLFARSMNNLANVDAGFQRDGILVTDIDFTTLNLPNEGRLQFANELLKRLRGIAGVQAAAMAEIVPLSGNGIVHDILMRDNGEPEGDAPTATFNRVTPDYFRTMGTAFLAGRDFDDRDQANSPSVAIVTETFLKKFGKEANPLGTRFRVRRLEKTSAPYEIVGVVKDTKYGDLREDFRPLVYTAMAQKDHQDSDAQILIRSNSSLFGLIASVKSVASEANPDLDVSFVPFHKMIEDGLLRDRLMARLSGFFGMLAVLLAVVGLYGVISYLVASRRTEIGIRMALGARQTSIIWLVLSEASLLLVIGLSLGAALALAMGRTATSLLFGRKPTDASTSAMALTLLSIVAIGAAFLPAFRAASINPMACLRNE
jgi:putative ABC transport system permease protein